MYLIKCVCLKLKLRNKVKMNGAQALSITASFNVKKNSCIYLGRKIHVYPGTHFGAVNGGTIVIGDRTFVNRNCLFVSREKIEIGADCSFGPGVVIYDHDHTMTKDGFEQNNYKCAPVKIGYHCWVGANAIILKGTTIGDNCVIGAGCIVKGIVPNNSIIKSDRSLIINELY